MNSGTIRSSDGRVVIDSRLRARRVAVRRGHGRKRLQRLSAVALIVVVLAAGYGITRSPVLAVKSIELAGATETTRSQVSQASGIAPGVAMIDINAKDAQRKLQALPWVDTAKVQREWPNEVRVTLTERAAVARLKDGSAWLLVDKSGRVLERTRESSDAMLVIEGIESAEPGEVLAGAEFVMPVVTRIPDVIRSEVSAVTVAGGTAVELALRTGGSVTLSGSDQLSSKYVALATMFEHLPPLGEGCKIDVSVPSSPVVIPEEGCV